MSGSENGSFAEEENNSNSEVESSEDLRKKSKKSGNKIKKTKEIGKKKSKPELILEVPKDVDSNSFYETLVGLLKERSDDYDSLVSIYPSLDQQMCVQICQKMMKESEEVKIAICQQLLNPKTKAKYLFAHILGRTAQWQDRTIYPFIIGFVPLLLWGYLFQTSETKNSAVKPDEHELESLEICLLELYTLHLRNLEFKPFDPVPALATASIYHPGYRSAISQVTDPSKEILDHFVELNISNQSKIFQGLLSLYCDFAAKVDQVFLLFYCIAAERLVAVGTPISSQTREQRSSGSFEAFKIDELLNLDSFPKISLNVHHLSSMIKTLPLCFLAGGQTKAFAGILAKQLHRRACLDLQSSVIIASQFLLEKNHLL